MARQCKISKTARQTGHRVSHAKNRTKHVFQANLQTKRVYSPELKKFVRVKVSTRIIRTIDKLGLDATLRKYRLKLSDITAKV
jgi:large subunit ribosomal protein L28